VAVTANHAGVLQFGHNADTASAVAIADNLLKHHDILLLPTMNPASPLFTRKERARLVPSGASAGASQARCGDQLAIVFLTSLP
jgi:hypothetical protein